MDFSQMSDEQLQKLAGSNRAPSTIASPLPDMSQLSDEELQKLAGGNRPASTIPQVQQGDVPGYGESFLRGAGQGITLGYGPRIAGALKATSILNPSGAEFPSFDIASAPLEDRSKEALSAYEKTVKEQTAANEAASEAHPVTYFGGNVAGGIMNPVARLMPSTSLTSAALQGAISGSSEGDTLEDRAKNTAIGGTGGVLLGKLGQKIFGSGTPEINEAVQKAKDINVSIPKFAASDSIFMHSAANILRNFPIVGEPIEKAARNTMQQLGKAADNLGGVDPHTSGKIFGDSIKDWISNKSENVLNQAYNAASQKMDQTVRTPLSNTLNTVADIAANRQNAAIPGQSGAVNYVRDAINRADGLNFDGIKNLRTFIGQKMNGGILPEDVSGAELKQIYAALTQDLDSAANNAGGTEALGIYKTANNLARMIADKREALSTLIGGNQANASNENIFGNIFNKASTAPGSADIDLLNKVKSVMTPEEWQNAVSGVISHMGRDADGNFSPSRFLGANGFNKLSDAGKNILFGGDQSPVRNSLETIANVSRQFANLQKYANPSGTGHAMLGAETAKDIVSAPMETAASLFGGRKLAELISNPATSGATGEWAKAYLEAMKHATFGDQLNQAGNMMLEGTARGAFETLKQATHNLATINAGDTLKRIGQLTQGVWQPAVNAASSAIQGTPDQQRQGRATGGSVRSPEDDADRLIRLAERAKNSNNKVTEPLLGVDDNTIAHALDVAQAAI